MLEVILSLVITENSLGVEDGNVDTVMDGTAR